MYLTFLAKCLVSNCFHLLSQRTFVMPGMIHTMRIQQQLLHMSADSGNIGNQEGDNYNNDDDEEEEKPKPFKGFSKKREQEIIKEVQKSKEEILADQRLESQIRSTKMFEKKRAREEAELDAKIAAVQEEEDLIASDPSVGAVPEVYRA